jgi:hypothetical protein
LLLDAIVVEDSEGDGGLSNSTGTNQSDGSGVTCKTNDLLNPLVSPKEDTWWRWWRFAGYARCKYQILDSFVVEIADLV